MSVVAGIPLTAIICLGLPSAEAPNAVLIYISMFLLYGLAISWAGNINATIFAEVPWQPPLVL